MINRPQLDITPALLSSARGIVGRTAGRKLIKGLRGIVGCNQIFTRSRAHRQRRRIARARLNPLGAPCGRNPLARPSIWRDHLGGEPGGPVNLA